MGYKIVVDGITIETDDALEAIRLQRLLVATKKPPTARPIEAQPTRPPRPAPVAAPPVDAPLAERLAYLYSHRFGPQPRKFLDALYERGSLTEPEVREVVGIDGKGFGGFLGSITQTARLVGVQADEVFNRTRTVAPLEAGNVYGLTEQMRAAIAKEKGGVS